VPAELAANRIAFLMVLLDPDSLGLEGAEELADCRVATAREAAVAAAAAEAGEESLL
jgi:hypothetical protein